MRRFKPVPPPFVPSRISCLGINPLILAEKEKFESQLEQVLVPMPPEFESVYQYLACCRVWTGAMSSGGEGRIFVNRRQVSVHEFARELYRVEPWGDYKLFTTGVPDRKKVYRCVAAGTKNCVHRDHMGWVLARANPMTPTTLRLRDSIRYHFTVGPADHQDRWSLPAIANIFHFSQARIARILLYLEGPEDPRIYEQLHVSASVR